MTEQIDVVVRFHDFERSMELERCVFSIASQTFRPVNIILATQRFSSDQQAQIKTKLSRLVEEDGVSLQLVNWDQADPADARTALFKIGADAARGRYLAFLDYDDVLYPEAYAYLIEQLEKSGAGIAFASVRVASVDVFQSTLYTTGMDHHVFMGNGLTDLLKKNFCPLHSYVIDRSALPSALEFDVSITREEDYAMLLQIVSQVPSNFDLLGTDIGLYAYKTDGSNTVPTARVQTDDQKAQYRKVEATMQGLKDSLPVSAEVQKSLGLRDPKSERTVTEVVAQLEKKAFLSPLKRA